MVKMSRLLCSNNKMIQFMLKLKNLRKKRNDLHNEWNEKWRIYNDQQHLIDYIKRAEKHKDYLRRQEQKKKRD